MDIFVVTVTYGPNGTRDSFFYKDRQAATKVFNEFTESLALTLSDDFGNIGSFDSGAVHGIRLSDMAKSFDAEIEQSLLQAQAQAKAQRRASADPALRLGGGMPVSQFVGRG